MSIQTKQLSWVKLCRYCELSGDTADAVQKKRASGKFVDGIHSKIAPDGNVWINLEAVEKWVEQGNLSTLTAVQAPQKSSRRRVA